MLSSSGHVAQVDEKFCTACETCHSYCQFGALKMNNGLNWVDEELCMGCGICVGKCAEGAISLRLEPEKGIPLQITELVKDMDEAHISQA
jgi:heterodisulfide reductase subunit A-like polyferredoxin